MADQSKTILVVEDEVPLLEVLSDELTKQGYVVLQSRNGAEGYRTAIDSKPDLILLDIVMPVLDGINTLKKLRSDEIGKQIPVILLTNLSDSDKVNEALQLGAYQFIVKSDWKMEDVVKKVKEILNPATT